jgi:phage/plasmid-associated DNA primase
MKSGIEKILPRPDPYLLGDQPMIERLIRLHGHPWKVDDKARIKWINDEWWAALFAELNPILHDFDEGFYRYDDVRGIYGRTSPDTLSIALSRQLLHAARDHELPDLVFYRTLAHLDSQLRFLRGITGKYHAFVNNPPLLAMDNGVVEIQGNRIRFHPFNARFAVRHKANVPYVAGASCPRYQEEILGGMFDKDDASLFIRTMGLCMAGINPCQRLHIIEGDANAGKSTILNIPIALLGPDRCTQLRTLHLDSRFELHSFHGKSLLYGVDVPQNFLNTEAAYLLKALVSDEYFHTEGKSVRAREVLRGPFNVLIVTNCKLSYRAQGDTPAWRRRLTIYHAQTPENRKRIANFGDMILCEEGPGIINLFLIGLIQALAEIKHTGDLVLTEAQQERVDALVLRSNSVETFVNQCITEDEHGSITAAEMVEAYAAFCSSLDWPPLSEQIFFTQVANVVLERFNRSRSHSLQREGKKSSRGWYGLSLSFAGTNGRPQTTQRRPTVPNSDP